MEYSYFLFTQLFYALHPNEIEYDLIYPLILSLYNVYDISLYNDKNKGEYESMEEFLKAQTIDFKQF